jgi:hypothetical protein
MVGMTTSRIDQFFWRIAGCAHTFTHLADHHGQIIAHRTNKRTAPAHGTTVIEQFLPLTQIIIGNRFNQAHHAGKTAKQGIFPRPHATHQVELVDRGIFRVFGFAVENTGLRTKAAAYTGGEKGRNRGINLLAKGIEATFEGSGHDSAPLRP